MSLPALQPELRALDVVDVIPPGHFGMLVTNENFAPHLRPGEIAVVDTNDKDRQLGELYVIDLGPDPRTGSPSRLRMVEAIRGFDPETGFCLAWGFAGDVELGDGRMARLVEGPVSFEAWPQWCQGRIVGVMLART